MTTPAAEVEKARAELREAIDDITTVQHRTIEREDGTHDHFTAPPLLRQVEDEITQQSAPAGAFTPRSKPPAWLEAVQLLADVDNWTSRYDGPDRCVRVRSWAAEMASGAPASVVDAAAVAGYWRDTVAHLLDPQPKFRLRGQSCPNCKAEKVWDRHDHAAEESHARPALEIDTRRAVCVCLHCSEEWEPPRWELLAQVLEQQKVETLQASGWDPRVRARSETERWDSRRT